jgi:hypothetical protein
MRAKRFAETAAPPKARRKAKKVVGARVSPAPTACLKNTARKPGPRGIPARAEFPDRL